MFGEKRSEWKWGAPSTVNCMPQKPKLFAKLFSLRNYAGNTCDTQPKWKRVICSIGWQMNSYNILGFFFVSNETYSRCLTAAVSTPYWLPQNSVNLVRKFLFSISKSVEYFNFFFRFCFSSFRSVINSRENSVLIFFHIFFHFVSRRFLYPIFQRYCTNRRTRQHSQQNCGNLVSLEKFCCDPM